MVTWHIDAFASAQGKAAMHVEGLSTGQLIAALLLLAQVRSPSDIPYVDDIDDYAAAIRKRDNRRGGRSLLPAARGELDLGLQISYATELLIDWGYAQALYEDVMTDPERVDALMPALAHADIFFSLDYLTDKMHHPDERVRLGVLSAAFENHFHDDDAVLFLVNALTDPSPNVQRKAIGMLSVKGSPGVADRLWTYLNTLDAAHENWRWAIASLTRLKDPRVLDDLVACVRATGPTRDASAVLYAAREWDHAAVAELFADLLEDPAYTQHMRMVQGYPVVQKAQQVVAKRKKP